MKIAFRVDASLHVATGHVMRCRTLATALAARGAHILFVCRRHPGHLIDMLRADGFEIHALPAPKHGESGHPPWLGVPFETDAAQTIEVLKDWRADWLIVDHYGLDHRWEALLRPVVERLLVIDDQANRDHLADVMLDQNYFQRPERRYSGRVPAECQMILGPRYALLRPEYGAHSKRQRPRDGVVRRVLLFVGGADTGDVTSRILRVLSKPALRSIEVDVVIGAAYPNKNGLQDLARTRGKVRLLEKLPHLADVMADADLSVGAGGTTIWERLCMGLPAIVISLARNQEPICQALASADMINYAGPIEALSDADLAAQIEAALSDPKQLSNQSLRGRVLVDGMGVQRVAEFMLPSAPSALALRRAEADDVLLYLDWANEPSVRMSAIESDSIPLESHLEWFTTRLASDKSELLVLEASGLPVGQIRFDYRDGAAWIDYSLDAAVRGRGWGRKLVELGITATNMQTGGFFMADVKANNLASIAVFKGLGFDELQTGGEGLRRFRLVTTDVRAKA